MSLEVKSDDNPAELYKPDSASSNYQYPIQEAKSSLMESVSLKIWSLDLTGAKAASASG